MTIITNIRQEKNKKQNRKTNLKNKKKLKFSMKSLTFLCLICALNLYFAQKLLRKAKFVRGCYNRKKLHQTPKVAQKLPSRIGKGLFWLTFATCNTLFANVFQRLRTISCFQLCARLFNHKAVPPLVVMMFALNYAGFLSATIRISPRPAVTTGFVPANKTK